MAHRSAHFAIRVWNENRKFMSSKPEAVVTQDILGQKVPTCAWIEKRVPFKVFESL